MWYQEGNFVLSHAANVCPIPPTPKGTPLLSPQLKQGSLRGGGDKHDNIVSTFCLSTRGRKFGAGFVALVWPPTLYRIDTNLCPRVLS